MAEAKTKFVPIDQIQSERLRVDLQLPPFIPVHQIGVNVGRVRFLCNIAGIDHLRVESVSQGTSGFIPVIVGMDDQGSAVAGRVGLKTEVRTFSTETDRLGNEIIDAEHPKRWTDAKVSLNTDEVARQIQANPEISAGLRSPEPWADVLNQSIKRCLIDEGTRHLILGLRASEWGATAFFWMYAGVMSSGVVLSPFSLRPHIPAFQEFLLQLMIGSAIWNGIDYTFSRSKPGHPYRLSLIKGPQLDRALILNTLGRLGRVAKVIDPQ